MKLALALFGAAAFYGGAHLFGTGSPAAAPGAVGDGAAAAGGTYRLVANGGTACTVTRGAAGAGGAFALRPAAGCERLMPGLARARVWREGADGTVAFSADGSHALVTFAAADGDGYESFRPTAPLLSLTALNPLPE